MCEYNIGAKLIELRTVKGVTQEEVANALSVSNKTVSKWENGASAPDLGMLVALARYYNVSADLLLGIGGEEKGTRQVIEEEFKGLCRQEAVLKSFELVRAMIPASFDANGYGKTDVGSVIPPACKGYPRAVINVPEMFNFCVRSDAVNLSVMLLRNKENFAWLTDPDKQAAILRLLAFLSDRDALAVCAYLHRTDSTGHFTAARVTEATGVPEEKVASFLETACTIPALCNKTVAHLATGDLAVYDSEGNGLVLAILSIAYEAMCGVNANEYHYGGGNKMIEGGEKA